MEKKKTVNKIVKKTSLEESLEEMMEKKNNEVKPIEMKNMGEPKKEIINNVLKIDDVNWKLISDKLYRYDESKLQNFEISVTNEMINTAKTKAKLYINGISDEKQKMEGEKIIYYFIKIYDVTNNVQPSFRCSRLGLDDALKTDLLFSYVEGKVTKLTPFLKNLENARYTVVDAYMSDQVVTSEMNNIRKQLEAIIISGKEEKKIKIDKSICQIYSELLAEEINKLNVNMQNKKKYYIYTLTNGDQEYIFGSFDKIKKTDYKKICDKYNVIFTNVELKKSIEQIQEIDVYFECEGKMKIDEVIYLKNKEKQCYNKNYNIVRNYPDNTYFSTEVEKIRNDIYLLVQMDYMKYLKICEDYDYDKILGYVAYIESEGGDIFVFSGYNVHVKKILEKMYYVKKCDILIRNDISKLKINILEKYIDKKDLEIKENYYKNQMEIIKINSDDKSLCEKGKSTEKKQIIKPYWNGYKYVQKYKK